MCVKKSKNSELDASFFQELTMDIATKWAISKGSGPDMEASDDVIVVSLFFLDSYLSLSLKLSPEKGLKVSRCNVSNPADKHLWLMQSQLRNAADCIHSRTDVSGCEWIFYSGKRV